VPWANNCCGGGGDRYDDCRGVVTDCSWSDADAVVVLDHPHHHHHRGGGAARAGKRQGDRAVARLLFVVAVAAVADSEPVPTAGTVPWRAP